jgi:3-methyladenine DNA glycosylase Tag
MSDLFWLTDEQMERLRPFFPRSHGKPHVDDRRVLSGIVFVNKNGLRWRDVREKVEHFERLAIALIPAEYDPVGAKLEP